MSVLTFITDWRAARRAPASQPSNLVAHARRELELVGEDEVWVDGMCRVVQAFADMGHSGGSASVAIPQLHELLQFHNLKPLTNNPAEWQKHGGVGPGCWQNLRRSEAFSEDGGMTYYLLSEGAYSGNPYPKHTSAPVTEVKP